MKYILIISSILLTSVSYSQELTCLDFKKGKFIIPKGVYSEQSYTVYRTNGEQVEYDENGVKSIINLKYLNECDYVMMKSSLSDNYTEFDDFANKNGGFIVTKDSISGDTFFHSGLLKTESRDLDFKGYIIKVE